MTVVEIVLMSLLLMFTDLGEVRFSVETLRVGSLRGWFIMISINL